MSAFDIATSLVAHCLMTMTITMREHSDETLREYLLYLDSQADERFILQQLDATHLLIRAEYMEWIRAQLDKHQDDNTYVKLSEKDQPNK